MSDNIMNDIYEEQRNNEQNQRGIVQNDQDIPQNEQAVVPQRSSNNRENFEFNSNPNDMQVVPLNTEEQNMEIPKLINK